MSTRPEHDASAFPARRAGESAEDIFARIQRHRRAGAGTASEVSPASSRSDTRRRSDGVDSASLRSRSHERTTDASTAAASTYESRRHATGAGKDNDSSLWNDEFSKAQPRQLVDFEVVDEDAPDRAADQPDTGQFPRSMTMRTLSRYPVIGLLIAAPAVGLVLRNPGIRQSLYRVGRMLVEQQMWAQIERLTRDRNQDRDRF